MLKAATFLTCFPLWSGVQAPDSVGTAPLLQLLEAQGVSGYEQDVRDVVRTLLPQTVCVVEDSVGNLIVRLGSGSPRVLIAAPLDEPGYVVSGFTLDGYLRLNRVGRTVETPLADQFIEGQRVTISTGRGKRLGVVACHSVHLHRDAPDEKRLPFSLENTFVDVGARSVEEVEAGGFRLLDPVTRVKETARLGPHRIAAPGAADRAGVAALVQAIRQIASAPVDSEFVFAFVAQDQLGRKGIDAVAARETFDRAFLIGGGFGVHRKSSRETEETQRPRLGSGVLVRSPSARGSSRYFESLERRAASYGVPLSESARDALAPAPYTGGPKLPPEKTYLLGVPSLYGGTPVECIDQRDVEALGRLLAILGGPETI